MRTFSVLVLVVLAGLAPSAVAQPRPRGPAGRQIAQRATPANQREAIKKRIRVMRAAALTTELSLDETTVGKLFPLLSRYDDETDKLVEKRIDVQRRLAAADTMKDGKAIDHVIDDAIANQKAFWDLEERRLGEIRKVLSPAQTARLLIVLPEFERRIQNQLRRAIAKRQDGVGGAGAKDNDDGDDDREPDEQPHPRGPVKKAPPLPPARPSSGPPGATPPCDPFSSAHCR